MNRRLLRTFPAQKWLKESTSPNSIAARQWNSGFLPSIYQGVKFNSTGDPVNYVRNPDGVNRELQGVGDPEVAVTWQAMAEGDLVVVEVSREACNAFDNTIPADAVIIGRADRVHIDTAS